LKILVVGDSFVPVAVFAGAFGPLARDHDVRFASVDENRTFEASTPSEHAISEYLGAPDQVAEMLQDASVLVVHGAPVTEEVMRAGPRLRLLGCARGGPVNIDVKAATRLELPVTLAPGKNAPAVADLTLAFMVMLARGLVAARKFLTDNGGHMASNFDGARFIGGELAGATLGLVGYGRVGAEVAARARGYSMRVVVYDPYIERPDEFTFVDTLDDLLGQADFVSLHARSTPETEGLIGAAALAAMKPGAWLINTARETLIDERALVNALDDGRLAGVALDVLCAAPNGERHPLIDNPRVLVTPHIGGATRETLTRGAQMVADAVAAFADGRTVPNLANPSTKVRPARS
jgi:D-3-phosphoglycerate dehydrogenase